MKTPGASLGLTLLALAALTSTACTGKTTREALATILALRGSVLLEGGASSAAQEAEAGNTLAPGQILRTTAGATASVLLLPGALAQLEPESSLQVGSITLTKNGNATDEAMERALDLRLLKGSLDVVVQFDSAPGTLPDHDPAGHPNGCEREIRPRYVRPWHPRLHPSNKLPDD
ncbi:MAG: hypothetical protein ABIR71_13810 [Chthoniobacterales bacterium]